MNAKHLGREVIHSRLMEPYRSEARSMTPEARGAYVKKLLHQPDGDRNLEKANHWRAWLNYLALYELRPSRDISKENLSEWVDWAVLYVQSMVPLMQSIVTSDPVKRLTARKVGDAFSQPNRILKYLLFSSREELVQFIREWAADTERAIPPFDMSAQQAELLEGVKQELLPGGNAQDNAFAQRVGRIRDKMYCRLIVEVNSRFDDRIPIKPKLREFQRYTHEFEYLLQSIENSWVKYDLIKRDRDWAQGQAEHMQTRLKFCKDIIGFWLFVLIAVVGGLSFSLRWHEPNLIVIAVFVAVAAMSVTAIGGTFFSYFFYMWDTKTEAKQRIETAHDLLFGEQPRLGVETKQKADATEKHKE